MITVRMEGVDEALRKYSGIEKQVRFAAALALTRTAQEVQKSMRGELASKIDKPTRYTLGGTFVRRAEKYNLEAIVGLIDKPLGRGHAQAKYLAALLSGGRRRHVGYERALQGIGAMPSGYQIVPGNGAKLDAYGNINRKQMTEVFGALKSSSRSARVYSGRGKRQQLAGYFAAMPNNPKTAHLPPGIYRRVERAGGSSVQPVLLFVRPGDYPRRLDLITRGVAIARREFPSQFASAFRHAISTAR